MNEENAIPPDQFWGLERLAASLVATPPAHADAAYYLCSALNGLRARYALAELSLRAAAECGSVPITTAILPPMPNPLLIEAHVSAFLFGAYSTIETAVFAAAALGFAVKPGEFAAMNDKSALRSIDVRDPLAGKRRGAYERHFRRFTDALRLPVVDELGEHHNASKHRHSTMQGFAVPAGGVFGAMQIRLLAKPTLPRSERQAPGLPPHAIAATELSVPLTPIVERWRALVAAMGNGLRDDIRELAANRPSGASDDG